MIILPKRFAPLAKITGDTGRLGLSNLHVQEFAGGHYRIEATDGRRAVILRGPNEPQDVDLAEPVEGVFDFFVPAEKWKEVFRICSPKGAVGLVAFPEGIVLKTSDGAQVQTEHPEGRFPDIGLVLPNTPPLVRFRLATDLLAGILTVADAVCAHGLGARGNRHIEFLFYKHGLPVGLICKSGDGQTMDAIVMPLGTADED